VAVPVIKRPVYRLAKVATVAAAALICVCLGWYLWQPATPAEISANDGEKTVTPVTSLTRREANTSGKTKQFILPDGTEVMLQHESELQWQEPFANNRRDIILKGAARFTVAKDPTKPFTVYSRLLSVTAIGTQFLVTDMENAHHTIVRLFEGKVVVQSIDSLRPVLKKDIYLLPGQELIYDHSQKTALVSNFASGSAARATTKNNNPVNQDNPSIPQHDKGSWYMFNNQSLKEVFDQLKEMYGVEIIYSDRDIQKMYFIGRFNKSDSVSNVLTQICTLNDLILTRETNNRFSITR
jgi:hypothetical protein